ncbi:MAG: DNA repair protein RecN, partial [Firmicutes bacterium]|nr:DNA repair protein RecN [Bacillota bacterium]
MLLQVSIRDIALIDRLEVQFGPGLNVLTGETGAGKSIVVGSLDFVLGGRADKDRIAGGESKGRVEVLFDTRGMPRLHALLAEMGLEAEDGLLPLAREINQSGRSICRAAGVIVPLGQLRQIAALLVDLHGQHQHQSLLDPGTHLSFLDAMGGDSHHALLSSVAESYAAWHDVKKELAAAEGGAQDRARREEMLRFALDELDSANLREGEEHPLEQKRAAMRNGERIRGALEKAYAYLSGGYDEELPSALDALRVALDALAGISRYGGRYEQAHDQLAGAVYELEAVSSDLYDLRDSAESDPRRLEEIEERMDLLSRLRRKYGATTQEMIAYRERVREQLAESEHSDERVATLRKEENVLWQRLESEAGALSASRHELAVACERDVLAQLQELGMQSARFEVAFAKDAPLAASGRDAVEFLLSANLGEPPRPLARVASGGELSRIMLAFKCIEAENEGIPVLVFDEIDTGISGRMGQIVGEKMRRAARSRQVLCVTHLPQIAALADAQYLVEKKESG